MRLIKSLFLGFFALIALKAHAIDQMYNWNGLEFVTSGNVTHVHPASPQSTVIRGGWTLDISDVEPKATATHPFPYKNKSNALVTVRPQIDPSKVSSRVAQGLKNAASGAASTGNGYVALGALACGLFDCGSAVAALADWGLNQLHKNEDGSLFAVVPDTTGVYYSTGYIYEVGGSIPPYPINSNPDTACSWMAQQSGRVHAGSNQTHCLANDNGFIYGYAFLNRRGTSTCLKGQPIINGQCGGDLPTKTEPIESYIQSNYVGKGWNHHWAKMTAAIVASGGNVFTDGTSTSITGPAIVPVSTSESKVSVSLVPGTTTPAPAGHIGPTDSGTQTTTTTTTAKNTYTPAPLSPASSGGPATGPSMTTTQETKTTTSITNNVTNITNIVNETTTEKDEPPEENATDTPLTGIPELYKQKYPDGFSGVWNSFKTQFNQTPFVNLIHQLTPNIPSGGSCPAWTIDLSWTPGGSMGVYRLGDDYCFIWPILKIIIIITALFTARRLVFGG